MSHCRAQPFSYFVDPDRLRQVTRGQVLNYQLIAHDVVEFPVPNQLERTNDPASLT